MYGRVVYDCSCPLVLVPERGVYLGQLFVVQYLEQVLASLAGICGLESTYCCFAGRARPVQKDGDCAVVGRVLC